MKLTLYLLLVLALVAPHFTYAQDNEAVATNLANYWARKAQQQRLIKNRQRAQLFRRRRMAPRTYLPPWINFREENEEISDDAEAPNAAGKKELELDDMQLWATMDLNKDGKLTVSEYERFSRSPNAQAFVRQMKAHKAVEQWAAKVGMDVEKAKAAMMVGANAQRRQNYANQQYYARLQAQRSRAALARRNQQVYNARMRRQNYWSRLGINPYMQQQYYQSMRRRGGRTEL